MNYDRWMDLTGSVERLGLVGNWFLQQSEKKMVDSSFINKQLKHNLAVCSGEDSTILKYRRPLHGI